MCGDLSVSLFHLLLSFSFSLSLHLSLSLSREPCFLDNQVQASRPVDRNHFHSVSFYSYALPLLTVMMLNEHFSMFFSGLNIEYRISAWGRLVSDEAQENRGE